jgi:hypothetical protein
MKQPPRKPPVFVRSPVCGTEFLRTSDQQSCSPNCAWTAKRQVEGVPFEQPPAFLRHLPLNGRGWFAVHLERVTVLDPAKRRRALAERLCWICGRPFGHRRLCFVLSPAQAATRVVQEPPSHPGCALFAVRTCPFMRAPDYQRSDTDPVEHGLHNPGCFVVWRTDAYAVDGDERVQLVRPRR